MKLRIKNNSDRDAFIKKVQEIDIKSVHKAEFTKIIRPRSISQNSYMWMCLSIAEHETGTDKNWFYSMYLQKFPVFEEREIFGDIHLTRLTSSQFNKQQMSYFIDALRNDLSEEGIPTPDADDKRLEEIFNELQRKGFL